VRGEIRAGWTPVAAEVLRHYVVTLIGAPPLECLVVASRALRWARLDRRVEALADLERARGLLEERVRQSPELPGPRSELGRTYLSLGRLAADKTERGQWLEQAKSALDRALEMSPNNAQYRQGRTQLEKELGQR
jgi:tetratricopeptide (TPR) repeat protein